MGRVGKYSLRQTFHANPSRSMCGNLTKHLCSAQPGPVPNLGPGLALENVGVPLLPLHFSHNNQPAETRGLASSHT